MGLDVALAAVGGVILGGLILILFLAIALYKATRID
jgi:hypothetical protein